MEPTNREIGAALREILKERGITQAALGETLGINQSSVSKIVRGDFPFDSARLKSLSVALGISRNRLEAELRHIIAQRPLSMRVSGSMQESTAPRGVPLLAPVAAGSANPRGLRVETIGMTRRITIGFDSTSNQLTPWTRFDVVLKN